jgi:16S rRNA (cytidine1402-2'-O)-methyltransferase
MKPGTLYLIPTPLGDQEHNTTIPEFNIQVIHNLDIFVVEELRTARRFLRKYGYKKDFDTVTFFTLNEHTPLMEIAEYLSPLLQGKSMGLLSEAGCPAVADPGSELVYQAQIKDIKVVPLTGPSSILLSLMASGLIGQQFTFHGYLPVKAPDRIQKIKEIDRSLTKSGHHTHIFIEAPYRNQHIIETLLLHCREEVNLCIASNITMPDESIKTKRIRDWKRIKPNPGKVPTVFLISI